MRIPCRCFLQRSALAAVALALVTLAPALAQGPNNQPPNALQGFSANRDKPIHINASTLEVRDKDKKATFLGNVKVVQGDTTLLCAKLDVFYDQENTPGNARAAEPGPGGQQQIRRLEAKGGVTVTQKDQTAKGETGIFDMRSNTVTLLGNVIMTQGPNVITGKRLSVDLTTGVSRVESDTAGEGGVSALILPNSHPGKDLNAATKEGRKETKETSAKDASKSGSKSPKSSSDANRPLKLN
jgi:lipopolysaccharide export system protein LptA